MVSKNSPTRICFREFSLRHPCTECRKKKELLKSRTTLVQRERKRKKITQHKVEKWISSKARSSKFLFFFFFLQEDSRFAYFRSQRRICIRQVYEVSTSAIFLSTEKMNFCTAGAVNEEIKWNYGGGYLWRRKYRE